MPELPQARVCHFTTERLRVKIPETRRDETFFDTVKERFATGTVSTRSTSTL